MMRKCSVLLILVLSVFQTSYADELNTKSLAEKNYFQFEIADYHTKRQGGQTLNVYVRYAYKDHLDTNLYFDYRTPREQVISYLEPTQEYPTNVYWEILATQIGKQLMRDYPISAVSVQLEVIDNPAGDEPGTHGPVFTMGDIAPLDVHH